MTTSRTSRKTTDNRPTPTGDCATRLGRLPAEHVSGAFAAVLTCIDGRVQQPLTDWMRTQYEVDYVDVITEPGIDAVLAQGDPTTREALLNKVCVSRLAHHAWHVVIAGHHDCAANPVDQATHEHDINTAVENLRTALPSLNVTGVFIDHTWTPQATNKR